MRRLVALVVLALVAYGAKWMYDNFARARDTERDQAPDGRIGFDTPTGTDPDAKYVAPGYEDKSFGQAVASDQVLVDDLIAQSEGDLDAAAARFRVASAGAPALERQQSHDEG